MDKTIKIVAVFLAVVAVISIAVLISGIPVKADPGVQESGIVATDSIYFFYGEECPACHYVMPFVINMTEKYPGANIQIREVWHNQTNQQLYQQINSALGVARTAVPEVVIGSTVLTGGVEIPEKFEALIQASLKKKA
ncbi:MAG: hypothetical protein M0R30_07730 [Methanoregula sp.]|jgi:thiol-disulfide isomerase/thioredoxin|uniref:hypothetical protein n=1 Tax=Methanoregula sp. TaxID=2052170 RepID=UPI0025E204CE|nr:hypothetical protein [Methanoregula sp.]MCK9631519.1 hypothetical protein [Methanoregula sp.]